MRAYTEALTRLDGWLPFDLAHLQLVFDTLLLASLLVFLFDALLRAAWRRAGVDDGRMIPLHAALTAGLALAAIPLGLGSAVTIGVSFLRSNLLGMVPVLEQLYDCLFSTVSLLWAVGLVRSVGGYLMQYARLGRRLARWGEAHIPAVEEAKRLAGAEGVRCVVVPGLSSPGAFGLLHPVVLLPEGFAADYTEREQLLLSMHELGHIRRHDTAWHFALRLLGRMFYLHRPLRRQLDALLQYRELCCDRRVMAACPAPVEYAELLIRELDGESRAYASFSGDGYRGAALRISALLTGKSLPLRRIAAVALAVVLGVSAVNVALAGPLKGYYLTDGEYALLIYYIDLEEADIYGFTDEEFEVCFVDSVDEADRIMAEADEEDYVTACLVENRGWNGLLAYYVPGGEIKAY